MRCPSSIIITLLLTTSAIAQSLSLNTTASYHLRTQVRSHQRGKGRFDNLWLVASHTGAGLNDAVFYTNKSYAIKGFQNATNLTTSNGSLFQYQEFDLGNAFPYGLSISDVNFYAAWEPVRINVGYGDPGFTMNQTGLQWNSQPSSSEAPSGFGGWLVCDWWHGKPQLFAKWRCAILVLSYTILTTNLPQLLRLRQSVKLCRCLPITRVLLKGHSTTRHEP